jgi:hypothetical protein
MASDAVLVGVIAVVETALGASIGLLAEPVRVRFARKWAPNVLHDVSRSARTCKLGSLFGVVELYI